MVWRGWYHILLEYVHIAFFPLISLPPSLPLSFSTPSYIDAQSSLSLCLSYRSDCRVSGRVRGLDDEGGKLPVSAPLTRSGGKNGISPPSRRRPVAQRSERVTRRPPKHGSAPSARQNAGDAKEERDSLGFFALSHFEWNNRLKWNL